MRIIAVLSNIALLSFVGYLLFDRGLPDSLREQLALVLLVIAPGSALISLLVGHEHSLIALMLERRALGEKRRIEELRSKQ
jgi:hypothetical protein